VWTAGARRWLAPAAIVALALVVRIVVIAADSDYLPANDAFEYDYTARSIAAGDGYPRSGYLLQGGPTAVRGPGYPYLLAGVYAVSGDSRAAGRLAGAALGALAVLLLYLIAKRIWGRRVGLAAATLAAVFPPLVLLSRDLVSESLFIALELGAVLCVLEFRRTRILRWAAAAGALCGLCALTRNTGFALLVPVALGLWVLRPRLRLSSILAPALAVACAVLAVTPWIVRDAAEFGRFVPVTTSAGIATSGTYNAASYGDADAHGAWRDPRGVPTLSPLFVSPGMNEAAVDAALRRDAWEFAWRHPAYVAETSAWNLLRLFEVVGGSVVDSKGSVVDDRGIGSAIPPSERLGVAIVAVLALLGIFAILHARSGSRYRGGPPRIPSGPLFLWLVPTLMILVAMPIAGLPRYRLPADPFLLILAAIGLTWLWERLAASRTVSA
jgi:4-amino-4-deoxy-L-arabinose transferase-like glycosyltransferase